MKTTADKILTRLQNRNSTVTELAHAAGVPKHKVGQVLREMRGQGKADWYWLYGNVEHKGPCVRVYYVPAHFTICRCECGTTNQHYYPPGSTSGRASQLRFWLEHKGPGHGPVTKSEMRAIKRRKKKERDSQ